MAQIASWRAVTVAAMLMTLAAVVLSLALLLVLYDGQDRAELMVLSPVITTLVALPFSFFVWAQVRRNVLLKDELQQLVNRDRLTNVATRDFFFQQMRDAPGAYGTSLMIDIDEFKSVNDTYGHLAGDAVIARVARILCRNVRDRDIVCRFGGEEFIVFLHEQREESGFEIAERMRRTIEQDALEFNGTHLKVTVSIGGSLKESLEDVEVAIQEADNALYRAKNAGRNRTVFSNTRQEDAATRQIDLWERAD